MQQRQLRLGDVLDDYCPRERRLTNHAVVAMIGDEVKLTRCTACDTEHEYKQAKVPRQRRKTETPAALYAQVLASAPKKVTHEVPSPAPAHAGNTPVADDVTDDVMEPEPETAIAAAAAESPMGVLDRAPVDPDGDGRDDGGDHENEGPVHRPLIRASLPKIEGQQPPARPIPEFTVRQPGGRQNRFRPRNQRGGGGQPGQFGQRFSGGGDRSSGNSFGGYRGGGGMRQGGGRPQGGPMSSHPPRRHGGGGPKRSK